MGRTTKRPMFSRIRAYKRWFDNNLTSSPKESKAFNVGFNMGYKAGRKSVSIEPKKGFDRAFLKSSHIKSELEKDFGLVDSKRKIVYIGMIKIEDWDKFWGDKNGSI